MIEQRRYFQPYSPAIESVLRITDAGILLGWLFLLFAVYGIEPKLTSWYLLLGCMSVIALYFCGELAQLYRSERDASSAGEGVAILKSWIMSVTGLLLLGYATKTSAVYSRRVVMTWFITTPCALFLCRQTARVVLARFRLFRGNTRTAAILGSGQIAQDVARAILRDPGTGLRLKGFYDLDDSPFGPLPLAGEDLRLEGSIEELCRVAKAGEIDCVYIALPMTMIQTILKAVEMLSDSTVHLYLVPNLFFSDLLQTRWSSLGGLPTVHLYDTPFYGVDSWLKRAEDLVLGSLVLLVTALPMLVIAAAIRATSGGPVLFLQHRYGIDGKEFVIWKFRTMNVAEDGAVIQATAGDNRVTRMGRFLRHTSMDELPQVLNVLQGRMSLVGPRPHVTAQNEEYRKLIHGYMLRYKVTPGITGWAQVNGFRGETDTIEKMQERVRLDLEYIRNWSLLFDLRILFLTVFGRKSRRGAY